LVAQLGIDGQVAAPIRPTFELPVAPSTPVMQSAEPAIGGSPPSQMAPQSGNLPPSLTRFFGREEEIHEILAQLRCEDTRLVTLTGPGGVGKTRLSIEIGLRLREEYRGQVWFVSLADITATDMIGSSLATVLRLPRLPEREPIEQAIDMLSRSPALLILDNLEQITEGLEGIVGLLLDRLSDLKIIATSRSIIGCEGEHEVALSLLPAPAPRASAEDMSTCASVRLFVDRAQMVRPDFQITPRNAAAIAALCERLDGLPLAIELAAAWASMLQPQQMLERLNQRFDLLVSQRKDRSVRHRTLRGAIEWSYNLLEPHLQRFYRQLATFSGGWTIEAAQEVCGEPRALELIRELHSRSLVIAEPHASEPRFRMLESIREFADERLGAEERAPLETAHSLYFLKVAREHEPYLTGSDGQERLDRLENDVDNLRAALDRLLQCGEMARAVEMAGSLWRFWYATARVSEGRRWLQRAFADCSSSGDALRAKALYGAGRLAACQNAPLAAIAFFEESLSLSAHSGDSAGVLSALVGLALIYWGRREYAGAARCLSQTLDLQRAIGERWPIACALSGLSEALQAAGDLQQALALERESAEIRERLGDRWGHSDALIGIAQLSERLGVGALHGEPAVALPTSEPLDDSYRIADTFLHLGYMAEVQGDYQVARNHYEDSLTIFRETANDAATAFALDNIGRIAYRQREIHTARLRFEEALEIRRYLKDTSGIAESLHHSAVAALSDADPVAARRLLREELAVRRELADGEGEARCLAELTLAEGV
jgi:predicted ATPase